MATDASGDAAGVSDFAHLHLHTQYSLLDGAIRTKDLCSKVRERGMKSVAVTDHGNMFGAIQFYKAAREEGVKPIFGCEAYVAEGDAKAKTDRKNYHIVLLAENETGFRNLQKLVSYGHLEGFYYNPRIDRAMLRKHSEGLIGLSACLGGHISRLVSDGDMDRARETVKEYRDIFSPGRYFLELQPNGMAQQELVNARLAELGRDLEVPIVATNDCHYVDRRESHAHEVLMCLGMGRTFDDPKRMRHECDEFFIKRPEEMWPYFERYPEAMENACRIARMCNVELRLGHVELPEFHLPEGVEDDLDGYLRRIAREGLGVRLGELRALGKKPDEAAYRARLEHELEIIVSMRFPGYFLIVWDFIAHAKKIGVPVGPGRGSGAGSLVAWSMRITDLDPLEYDLLFERFLNPDRVSMPDFDIDFCMSRREEVIEYVMQRYGRERVGQIATFHSLKARGLVRDVCRVMNVPLSEANDIAKAVPEGPKVTLSMCLADPADIKKKLKSDPKSEKLADALKVAEAAGKLRQRAEESPRTREILEIGCALEGLNRHAGMHAAGIVIGNRALVDHVPCFQADGRIITQYTMTDVEEAGLVKFDFLGLKTLTVIDTAVRLIRALPTQDDRSEFAIETIPMDDAPVFEMISSGDTTGVFQLESSGFKDLLKKLRPDCFEDIIAAVALYRPGPLEGGMVQQFIDCKHGRAEIAYPHPLLEPVLGETYGVFVYQEQVMQAAQVLAGFTLASADLMRRAMGKKKKSEMDHQRSLFVEGCASKSGISAKKANEIFDLIDKFAGYGFNKSHSAAYGLITYQTAWLKHHFPVCFMAALMTCDKDRSENVVRFIAEARAMGITVLPPCVGESVADFGVVEHEGAQAIRFGLGAVRNVGSSAVDSILAAREGGGAFENVFDLCRRVDLRRVNKRTLESLVCAGALDRIAQGQTRSRLFAALESAMDQGQSAQRDRESGQAGLFDMIATPATLFVERYPEIDAWVPKQELLLEREAIGFYLTGHPLDRWEQDVDREATVRIGGLAVGHDKRDVTIGGIACEIREVTTRMGKQMAFVQLEDQYGRIECVIFPKVYESLVDQEHKQTFGEWLHGLGEDPIFVSGKVEAESDESGNARFKLLVDRAQRIADVRERKTRGVLVRLRADQLDDRRVLALKHLVADHRGPCTMQLQVQDAARHRTRIVFGDEFKVTANDEFFVALERLFEGAVAELV